MRVSVDITGSHPKSTRGNQYILTLVDHFSKWAEAMPIRNHTAFTVARQLMINVFTKYGVPQQILTDRGTEFESELFRALLNWMVWRNCALHFSKHPPIVKLSVFIGV